MHGLMREGRSQNLLSTLPGITVEAAMFDNGPEFKGSLEREHPFMTFCEQTGLRHYVTKLYRAQTNGKVETFFKILNKEFFLT